MTKIKAMSVLNEPVEGEAVEYRIDGVWLVSRSKTGFRETKVKEETLEETADDC